MLACCTFSCSVTLSTGATAVSEVAAAATPPARKSLTKDTPASVMLKGRTRPETDKQLVKISIVP